MFRNEKAPTIKKIIFNDDSIKIGNKKSSEIILLDLTNPSILSDKDFFLKPQDIVYVEPMRKKFYSVKNLSSAVSISMSASRFSHIFM